MTPPKGKYDAKFHAFQILAQLTALLTGGRSLTQEEGAAVHSVADELARDLTSGEYEYTKRN